ncbi:hypothetical protein [Nostoc punctiforme]|uniref:Uncharacterized protein n=1 Tax=Nostoc punctiforme (strain ATCC 29133 / PCC 73102) TaxID=63737 RepID=B2JAQ6_NOSP7|nr:hypothetical protein [Nostoc punctiforme]ACC85010.1 hypothetical protein Npun_AR144 [Nostoc punctiforme PCC 73102]
MILRDLPELWSGEVAAANQMPTNCRQNNPTQTQLSNGIGQQYGLDKKSTRVCVTSPLLKRQAQELSQQRDVLTERYWFHPYLCRFMKQADGEVIQVISSKWLDY